MLDASALIAMVILATLLVRLWAVLSGQASESQYSPDQADRLRAYYEALYGVRLRMRKQVVRDWATLVSLPPVGELVKEWDLVFIGRSTSTGRFIEGDALAEFLEGEKMLAEEEGM